MIQTLLKKSEKNLNFNERSKFGNIVDRESRFQGETLSALAISVSRPTNIYPSIFSKQQINRCIANH